MDIQKSRTAEALSLAEEIIKDTESSEIPIEDICLKASRLAGIMNDTELSNKISGFPSEIIKLRTAIDTLKKGAAVVPSKSIEAMQNISNLKIAITKYKESLHFHAMQVYCQLKFGSVVQEIFEKTCTKVDKKITEIIPEAAKKLVSVFENLKSQNTEDWSNAVHTCRRILKDLADILYPPSPGGLSEIDRGGKRIKVGPDEFINRLMLYVEDKATSKNFKNVVGSHLAFLGNRLDSIYEASCKGSHTDIISIEEAERYIIYTYMLIGDVVSL